MLPIAQALPLGLALYGAGDYTLADGSTVTNFLAEGKVTILPPSLSPQYEAVTGAPPPMDPNRAVALEQETVKGTIVLGGDGALLGMEFMRSLDKLLLVGKVVILADYSTFNITANNPPNASDRSSSDIGIRLEVEQNRSAAGAE
jgi:hypothetical protein